MMSDSVAKLLTASLALLLVVSSFQEVSGREIGLRKVSVASRGHFGSKDLPLHGKEILPIRSLRTSTPSSPPAPTANTKKQVGGVPPPPVLES